MRHKLGIACMILGAGLLLSALGLLVYNQAEANRAARASAELMPRLNSAIAEKASKPDAVPEPEDPIPTQMPEVEIDGLSYIGYLRIPRLELEMPILSSWDDELLKIAPCRFSGSTMEDNLVLVAHNYLVHFGPIHRLSPGDRVVFVAADGVTTDYLVCAADIVSPTAVEEVTSGSFDLALVTCTFGGNTRLVVYCDEYTINACLPGQAFIFLIIIQGKY